MRSGGGARWARSRASVQGFVRGGLSARAGGVARMVAARFYSGDVEVSGVLLWVFVGFGFGLGGFLVSGWVGG
jgi:hypothetical protein|uniref:Uncharacterized protein n=1 Tax=Fagus sylvatica TaxID=28930 RepID=A0A2N9GRT5_FAGSY